MAETGTRWGPGSDVQVQMLHVLSSLSRELVPTKVPRVGCVHVTKFWLMKSKQKRYLGFSGSLFKRERAVLFVSFLSSSFQLPKYSCNGWSTSSHLGLRGDLKETKKDPGSLVTSWKDPTSPVRSASGLLFTRV